MIKFLITQKPKLKLLNSKFNLQALAFLKAAKLKLFTPDNSNSIKIHLNLPQIIKFSIACMHSCFLSEVGIIIEGKIKGFI